MNLKIVTTKGGGIFSKFLLSVGNINVSIQNLGEIENLYFSMENGVNYYDYVFDQKLVNPCETVKTDLVFSSYSNLLEHEDLPRLREIGSKILIKDCILNRINTSIDENTIGIHIRLTDMNLLHGKDWGEFCFDDFKRKLDDVIKVTGINKIFVASDNEESIIKLKLNFDVIYNQVSNRFHKEVDSGEYNKFLRRNFQFQDFWQDTFLEMLSLSKCGHLITRISNLNNAAVILAKNLKRIYYLGNVKLY